MQRSHGTWVLTAVIIGSGMVFIDGSVVNVALPVLQREFGATLESVQWVVESYALLLAALMLVGGALGDLFGRRKIFGLGIFIFGLSSAWCGLSGDIRMLIVARGVQGIGGALLTPGSLAILSAAFPPETRGKAIGTWSGFSAILAGFGPVLGGWLIDHASWRWAFWINVPLAAIALTISIVKVPESRDEERSRAIDWPGALLATVSLGLLVFGLTNATGANANPAISIAACAIGIVLLVLFGIVEWKSANAMMPLALFRSRTFAGANLLTLLLYAALAGALFFLPFNLIQIQGYRTAEAGAAFVPFVVLMFTLSRWSGGLVEKYGAKKPLIIGPIVAACGFGLFALPGIGGSYWVTFFPAVVLLGAGMSIAVAPLTTAVMISIPEHKAGIASGVNNAVSRIASLLAVAVFVLMMQSVFTASLVTSLGNRNVSSHVREEVMLHRSELAALVVPNDASVAERSAIKSAVTDSFIAGFRWSMLTAALLAVASAGFAWRMIDAHPKPEA